MTAPPMDPEARKRAIAAVFDRGAETYDQVGVDFFTPAARDLVTRAELRAGERVLDVGTGRGAALFAAAEAVGLSGRAVGIDLSPKMAELTRLDAAAKGFAHVMTLEGDAEQPDFADASFDVVLAALVIFFLPDPAAALRNYAALLAPGGRLAFSTFGAQDAHFDGAMKMLGSFVPADMPDRGDRQGPFSSPAHITELLTAHGFVTQSIDEATYESRFSDGDHWVSWLWSHGGRHILEQVPADRLEEAVDAAKAVFESARTPAGDYAIRTEIRFTIATVA
jgi:ubiquinone/menaquinone biosynthesis C-methylase UbiE